jgi:hypothetical protein
MKKLWRIFWIVYAWLMVLIGIGGIISDFAYGRVVPPKDIVFSIIYVPMVIALVGYAHRWRIWKSGVYFWRAYLFIYIAGGIAQDILNNWLPSQLKYKDLLITVFGVAIPLILTIISIIGVYLYAFRFLKIAKEPLANSNQ